MLTNPTTAGRVDVAGQTMESTSDRLAELEKTVVELRRINAAIREELLRREAGNAGDAGTSHLELDALNVVRSYEPAQNGWGAVLPDSLLDRDLLEALPPEVRPRFESALRRLRAHRTLTETQFEQNAGGYRRRYQARFIAMPDDRVRVALRELESADGVAHALRESEERYRALVRNIPGVVYLCSHDARGTFAYLSEDIEALTGIAVEEFLHGRVSLVELYHPGDVDSVRAAVSAAVRERHQYRVEYRIRHVGGDWRWVEEFGQGIFGSQGELRFVQGTIFDISERKQMEVALRSSERFLQRIIDGIPDTLMVVDRNLKPVLANRAAQSLMIGCGSERNCLSCEQAFTVQVKECAECERQCPLKRVLTTRTATTVRQTQRDASGNRTPVEVVLAPLLDDAGEVTQIVQLSRDITQRRQLEQRLQQTQKAESLGVLAGGIAHEFNNILVGVLTNAALAEEGLPEDSPSKLMLGKIQRSAQRAANLTNQMLAYSGKGRFVVEPVDLSRLLQDMSSLLHASVPKKVTLAFDLAGAMPQIEADAAQLRQVVVNLVSNAADALGDHKGMITIRTGVMRAGPAELANALPFDEYAEGEYAYLEVADTGAGIPKELESRIFDPFFTTKFTGRGLGLAAVLGIVRGHRGAILKQSEPGHGSVFRILIPPLQHRWEVRSAAPVARAPHANGQQRVLVVDDEPEVLAAAGALLEHAGFNVLRARNGREAVRLLGEAAEHIDVVLLDLMMPDMSGTETIRAMRELRPELRVVLTSGFDERDATSRFRRDELSGFVQKPYMPQDLLGVIRGAIAAPA